MRFKEKIRIYLCIYLFFVWKNKDFIRLHFFPSLFCVCLFVLEFTGMGRIVFIFSMSHKFFVYYSESQQNWCCLCHFVHLSLFFFRSYSISTIFISFLFSPIGLVIKISYFCCFFFFFWSIINNIHFICVISLKQLRRSFVSEDCFNVQWKKKNLAPHPWPTEAHGFLVFNYTNQIETNEPKKEKKKANYSHIKMKKCLSICIDVTYPWSCKQTDNKTDWNGVFQHRFNKKKNWNWYLLLFFLLEIWFNLENVFELKRKVEIERINWMQTITESKSNSQLRWNMRFLIDMHGPQSTINMILKYFLVSNTISRFTNSFIVWKLQFRKKIWRWWRRKETKKKRLSNFRKINSPCLINTKSKKWTLSFSSGPYICIVNLSCVRRV